VWKSLEANLCWSAKLWKTGTAGIVLKGSGEKTMTRMTNKIMKMGKERIRIGVEMK
jgi:hypothetical protein